MYYSSESSDSENINDSASLDFSFLLLDTETIGSHLQNSVFEQMYNENLVQCNNCEGVSASSEFGEHECRKSRNELDFHENFDSRSVRKKEKKSFYKIGGLDQFISNSNNRDSPNEGVRDDKTQRLFLQHNMMGFLPFEITLFSRISHLDISQNNMTSLNEFLLELVHLESLSVKNNVLDDNCFPKDLTTLKKLRELNLSGNQLTTIPPQLFAVTSIKYLYLGGNQIEEVSSDIKQLQNLQVLHLGGNMLEEVPSELGELPQLGVLALCDNRLKRLPRVISRLTKLRSLLLHNNNLCCLPVEIVKLKGLSELSIKDNPLVRRFVDCCAKELMYTPPSLMELAARVIKLNNITYEECQIPRTVQTYLHSGHNCVNPKCKGMYFTSCIAHIKFVDFCGKYRVPLMHYLCSSRCSSNTPAYYRTTSESESDEENPHALRKVLLG